MLFFDSFPLQRNHGRVMILYVCCQNLIDVWKINISAYSHGTLPAPEISTDDLRSMVIKILVEGVTYVCRLNMFLTPTPISDMLMIFSVSSTVNETAACSSKNLKETQFKFTIKESTINTLNFPRTSPSPDHHKVIIWL